MFMKKKIIISLLASGIITSGLMASDAGFYAGLDFAKSELKMSSDGFDTDQTNGTTTYSEAFTDDLTSVTLKAGYSFNSNHRVNVLFQHMNADDYDGVYYGAGYDYLIGSHDFKPFVGVFIGHMSLDSGELSGVASGVQIGLNYTLNKKITLDLGYRWFVPDISEGKYDGDDYDYYSVDSVSNLYIGANYKF
jgi:opacity protein-like surface antigen